MSGNTNAGLRSFRKVLLDNPTSQPVLGYRDIGRAFATIISHSEPRFAIGIFGGWGSGKTTLMAAIKAELAQDTIVSVDFNAWRFEREPQLLMPLLDTVQAALVRWSEPHDPLTRERVRSVATRVGRVVKALAAGLSAQVGLPGAVTVNYDLGTALDALSPPEAEATAQSLYVSAFLELERAFEEFSAGGATRSVVFVDDLDRCLPGNALNLLEAIKLFFDLPGFIFVVGLDEDIVQRAIRAKFADLDEGPALSASGDLKAASTPPTSKILAREYVKKIFQLPYSLPRMVPQQLNQLLNSIYGEAEVDGEAFASVRMTIQPYLRYIAIDRRVNPREVKRFINAFTLQTLIRSDLDPSTILALQTLTFRYDWEQLYEALVTDSALFVDILRRYRDAVDRDDSAFEDLAPELTTLPPSLASYLRSELGEPLARHPTLDTYISSLESTRSAKSWEVEAYRLIGRLRRAIRSAVASDSPEESVIDSIYTMAIETASTIGTFIDAPSEDISRQLGLYIAKIESTVSDARTAASRPEQGSRSADRAALLELSKDVEYMREELQIRRYDSLLGR